MTGRSRAVSTVQYLIKCIYILQLATVSDKNFWSLKYQKNEGQNALINGRQRNLLRVASKQTTLRQNQIRLSDHLGTAESHRTSEHKCNRIEFYENGHSSSCRPHRFENKCKMSAHSAIRVQHFVSISAKGIRSPKLNKLLMFKNRSGYSFVASKDLLTYITVKLELLDTCLLKKPLSRNTAIKAVALRKFIDTTLAS